MRKGYVSPSLMCVDLMNVQSDIEKLEKVGVDYFHVDMMDNHFVTNITLSTDFIKALKKISKTPLDIHMMIELRDLFAAFRVSRQDHVTANITLTYLNMILFARIF